MADDSKTQDTSVNPTDIENMNARMKALEELVAKTAESLEAEKAKNVKLEGLVSSNNPIATTKAKEKPSIPRETISFDEIKYKFKVAKFRVKYPNSMNLYIAQDEVANEELIGFLIKNKFTKILGLV